MRAKRKRSLCDVNWLATPKALGPLRIKGFFLFLRFSRAASPDSGVRLVHPHFFMEKRPRFHPGGFIVRGMYRASRKRPLKPQRFMPFPRRPVNPPAAAMNHAQPPDYLRFPRAILLTTSRTIRIVRTAAKASAPTYTSSTSRIVERNGSSSGDFSRTGVSTGW